MKSARSTPLDGLAFLISAITAGWPAAILARRAPTKSRVRTRLSASKRMAASDLRWMAAATSSHFTATILFRISVMLAWLLRAIFEDVDKHAVQHQPRDDKQHRDAYGNPGPIGMQQGHVRPRSRHGQS